MLSAIITYDPRDKENALLLGDAVKTIAVAAGDDLELFVEHARTESHAQTVNNGLRRVKGDYILISNEDVRVHPETFDILLPHFKDERVWAVVPMECRGEPSIQRHMPFEMNVKPFLGSFFIISRACYETIGGYDERFKPCFYDDNDYWMRILQSGHSILRDDRVQIHHKQSVALEKILGENKRKAWEDNRKLFVEKWGDDAINRVCG